MIQPSTNARSVTVKDIAVAAGVSTGTVHRALHGKKGVGEALRGEILRIADEKGYRPNEAAAALKRKKQRVLMLAPGARAQNKFYYTYIWQGFRTCASELGNFNIEIIELPYYNVAGNRVEDELESAFKRFNGEINGILAAGHFERRAKDMLSDMARNGVGVAIATDEVEGALVNVQPDYVVTGQLAAELLSSQLPRGSKALIVAGKTDVRSHYEVAQGFSDYMTANDTGIECVHVYGYGEEQRWQVEERITELLRNDESIKAMFSVNARGSVLMADLARRAKLAGRVRVIGSDVFDENIRSMRDGVMQNIIYKSPFEQAYQAAKVLFEYLRRGETPPTNSVIVESSVIFNSNLHMYIK